MEVKNQLAVETKNTDVIMTRTFDAPRKLVYKAWTDPKIVAKWFGPHGFTVPVCEMDVRKGGNYRIVMRGPDGTDYPMKGIYTEVVENEKVVSTADLEEHPQNWKETLMKNLKNTPAEAALKSSMTVLFADGNEGKTKLSLISHFTSDEIRRAYMDMGMVSGWTETLEGLEAELKKS